MPVEEEDLEMRSGRILLQSVTGTERPAAGGRRRLNKRNLKPLISWPVREKRSYREKQIVKHGGISMKKLAGLMLVVALAAGSWKLAQHGPGELFDKAAFLLGRFLTETAGTSADCQEIREILEDTDAYPENLRKALSENPELLPFAEEWENEKDRAGGRQKSLYLYETVQKCPLFLQWDKRWGYDSYGKSCIGLCGCGPTALSMVVYSLTRKEEALPGAMAREAMEKGYYVDGQGTSWLFMRDEAADWGLQAEAGWMSEETMRKVLEEGGLIILSVGAGDFTSEGHFIVVRACNETGFYVNDPNRRSTSFREDAWTYGELSSQALQMWNYRS